MCVVSEVSEVSESWHRLTCVFVRFGHSGRLSEVLAAANFDDVAVFG